MSDAYRTCMDLTVALHKATRLYGNDSPEADAIREEFEDPWDDLPHESRPVVQRLSGDLYSLFDPPDLPLDLSPSYHTSEEIQLLGHLMCDGAWGDVLDLLATKPTLLSAPLRAKCRAMAYAGLGEHAIAALFAERAVVLEQRWLDAGLAHCVECGERATRMVVDRRENHSGGVSVTIHCDRHGMSQAEWDAAMANPKVRDIVLGTLRNLRETFFGAR